MPKVSINILTWNTIKTLKMTLEVLNYDLAFIDHEIIIVDQGSIDGCEKLASIANETNLGTSKGKNQGIDASKGKYIVMLDGDVVPVPNSIPLLIQMMDETGHDAIGMYPNQFTQSPDTAEKYCHELTKPVLHSAACLFYGAYRRSIFDRVRLDDSGEFGNAGYGWEDRDFFMQMQKAEIYQYVVGINSLIGKYYHTMNSSFKMPGNMTHQEYVDTSLARNKYFKEKWGA